MRHLVRLVLAGIAAVALILAPALTGRAPARAQAPVDTALVLVTDASGSIDPEEFQLQKEGIAAAITDERILATIQSGARQRIAIAYVEWGSPAGARTVVDWAVIGDRAGAEAFAGAVLAAPRSRQSFNAIGDAIDHAAGLLRSCPCQPTRRVIDISGDNRDMNSLRPAPLARDAAVASGIVINALAILDGTSGTAGRPGLVEYYESEVIGGGGSFVIAATSRADFARALRQKLVRELAGPVSQPGRKPL